MSETPPICDYEGSDYQTVFWEEGGRAYEDAVEAVALKRLLPKSGKLLLELGAGAGRNTPRYEGFEKTVLLDYSFSQLEKARERLGDQEGKYRFVAADIYRLPFVDGLFDGATMIRTLHHMTDPHQALSQVRKVLRTESVFILEFANKKNLKAIFRYLTRRQQWNPFTPDPVEFAPLNFDFHPDTVKAWLKACNFAIDRRLTVSHFRIGFFKKIFPLAFLVWLDSLAQLTGDYWQLSPSVFARTHAVGETPLAAEGAFFKCPLCGTPLEDTPPELVCTQCSAVYPVKNGVYDFRNKED